MNLLFRSYQRFVKEHQIWYFCSAGRILTDGNTTSSSNTSGQGSPDHKDQGYCPSTKFVEVTKSAYEAAENAHAIVICTEWDEFKNLDYAKIYAKMEKPAFIFDGRKILNHENLIKMGFHCETIGKKLEQLSHSNGF